MVGRVIIRLINDADLMSAQVDALSDETHDGVEIMQHYGFASRPNAGAEALMISVGGMRDNGVIIATTDRTYRFKLNEDGEVAISDDLGQAVYLSRDGILVTSPIRVDVSAPDVTVTANKATLNCDEVEVSGNLTVGGDLSVTGYVEIDAKLTVDGDVVLGAGATKFVMLADATPSTKVKAK